MDAAQATNQLIALSVKQQLQIQSLMAAQYRAQALDQARAGFAQFMGPQHMNDLGIIDRFLAMFIQYIDSGFGLLGGDVGFLTTVLVGIDITLAGLFWGLDGETDVIARLVKKTLYVGAFALILNNFSGLAQTLFDTFAQLGLKAAGAGGVSLAQPGQIAATGYSAAWPLLQQAGSLIGFTTVFDNLVTIVVLLFAWAVVILAFFILAVQVFITILEFKLTTLAGFILVPFALWGRTAFLAERVLGNVISSGIKVMVLAVITGIGTTLFGQFTGALQGRPPGLADAMSLVLASIALFGLGIFGPGIAAGLVSGAPQLGAGSAVGTIGGLAAGTMAGGAAAMGMARGVGSAGLAAIRAGTSLGSGAATAYRLGQATSGATGLAGIGAGIAGVARGAIGTVGQGMRDRLPGGFAEAAASGRQAGFTATGGSLPAAPTGTAMTTTNVPAWARRLQADQRFRARTHAAAQAIKEGDRPGHGAAPDLHERE